MRYHQLMILVPLATFAAASTTVAVCLALAWERLEASLAGVPAVARARRLLLLRLAPVLAGLLACGVSLLAFLRYEPRTTAETPGWILLTCALAGAGLTISSLWRFMVRCRTTGRFLRTVERTATRITVPGVAVPTWRLDITFPLVALAGVWRSRLLIARCVLEQIPDDELHVVLKHELAHARHRDNLTRLLLTALPDVVGLAERWLGIERAWHEAAEDAADDLATGDDPQARVRLASALVRVARMAGRQALPEVPLLAFHRGEPVERRVRRLLEAARPRSGASMLRMAILTIALLSGALGLWLGSDLVLLGMHHSSEWLVNARP